MNNDPNFKFQIQSFLIFGSRVFMVMISELITVVNLEN